VLEQHGLQRRVLHREPGHQGLTTSGYAVASLRKKSEPQTTCRREGLVALLDDGCESSVQQGHGP
jgi:hypothetical protein